jgi:hypothetical protein
MSYREIPALGWARTHSGHQAALRGGHGVGVAGDNGLRRRNLRDYAIAADAIFSVLLLVRALL